MRTIICIAGRSGSGKTTLSWKLLETFKQRIGDVAKVIVSSTTRPMREGEVDGVDHQFKTMYDYNHASSIVAETVYCGSKYWTELGDFDKQYNIYVIDEDGIKYLKAHYADEFNIVTVRLSVFFKTIVNRGIPQERYNRDPKPTLSYDYVFENNDETDMNYACNRLVRDAKLNKF